MTPAQAHSASLSPVDAFCGAVQLKPISEYLQAQLDAPASFWARTRIYEPTGCWLWIAHRTRDNYGEARIDGKTRLVHRYAYECAYGPIPAGLVVRHRCNCAQCVNPAHLCLGTHADNVADRVAAGRSACGERNGRAKLTSADVVQIRCRLDGGESCGAIAARYDVSARCIRYIRDGEHWCGGERAIVTSTIMVPRESAYAPLEVSA